MKLHGFFDVISHSLRSIEKLREFLAELTTNCLIIFVIQVVHVRLERTFVVKATAVTEEDTMEPLLVLIA